MAQVAMSLTDRDQSSLYQCPLCILCNLLWMRHTSDKILLVPKTYPLHFITFVVDAGCEKWPRTLQMPWKERAPWSRKNRTIFHCSWRLFFFQPASVIFFSGQHAFILCRRRKYCFTKGKSKLVKQLLLSLGVQCLFNRQHMVILFFSAIISSTGKT